MYQCYFTYMSWDEARERSNFCEQAHLKDIQLKIKKKKKKGLLHSKTITERIVPYLILHVVNAFQYCPQFLQKVTIL